MECIKPCKSVSVNSTMKALENMGQKVEDSLDTANRSQISRDQQTGEKSRRNSFVSHDDVEPQNAKRIGERGRNETKLTSSPFSKPGYQETKPSTPSHSKGNQQSATTGIARGGMIETRTTSPIHSNGNQQSATTGITRGGMIETRTTSPTHSNGNQQSATTGIARGGMIETRTTSPTHSNDNQQSATTEITRGRVNKAIATSPSNRNVSQHSATKGTNRGRVNEARANSSSNSNVNHHLLTKGLSRGIMNKFQPRSTQTTSVPKLDSKRKAAKRRMKATQRRSKSSSSVKQKATFSVTLTIGVHKANAKASHVVSVQMSDREKRKADQSGTNDTPKPESKSKSSDTFQTKQQATSKSRSSLISITIGEDEKSDEGGIVNQTIENNQRSRPGYDILKAGETTITVKRYAVKKTWKKALEQCRSDGGALVQLNTRQKQRSVIKQYSVLKQHWIGLNDLYDNDTFFWIDGEPLTFTKWQNEEPHHIHTAGKKENCVALYVHVLKGRGWADHPCDNVFHFICEI